MVIGPSPIVQYWFDLKNCSVDRYFKDGEGRLARTAISPDPDSLGTLDIYIISTPRTMLQRF
jgi:hypothetical protein